MLKMTRKHEGLRDRIKFSDKRKVDDTDGEKDRIPL